MSDVGDRFKSFGVAECWCNQVDGDIFGLSGHREFRNFAMSLWSGFWVS